MADPSARITLITSLPASPGCCAICGKSEHADGFAATDNFDFEFYGTVYFCADCIGDYARLFGYKSPSEMDDLTSRVEQQEHELDTLRAAVILMENTIDNLTGLSDFRRDRSDTSSGDVSVPVADVPAADPSVEESAGTGEQEVVTVNEPDIEQGSDDVRDFTSTDTSIDELLAL